MAVIALLGLLAGAGVWSMTGSIDRASREDALDKLAYADRMARLAADRLGRMYVLRFDLDRQTVTRRFAKAPEPETTTTAKLPRGTRLEAVRLPRKLDWPPNEAAGVKPGIHTEGVIEIPVSTAGRSATYALKLIPTGDVDADDPAVLRPWIVFAGLTGQPSPDHDSDAIDNLFQTLDRGRLDAD